MPGEVIPLLGPPAPGARSFLVCECQNAEDPAGMWPVVTHDAYGAFICALVCPECENEVPISYGRPG